MKNIRNNFIGKKITIIGLGLLGRGVGDTEFLAECGAELIVTDLKTREQLASSLEKLSKFKNITYVLGEHRLEDFRNRDLIVKAAGVPFDSPFIGEAQKNHIPVRMSADLFAELSGVPIIGVTGTRGKTTTAYLIFDILKLAGKKVLLGGNVKGISTLSFLREIELENLKPDFAVLELDSWQLQGFGEAKLSPHIAVFTNFLDDHLNYYQGDRERYIEDKANIFKFQQKNDVLIVGNQVAPIIKEKYGSILKGTLAISSSKDVPQVWKPIIRGEHNRENISAALQVARTLLVSDDVSRQAIENFKGVSGRLELVKEIGGISIYNDTTSTTPDATIAALKALDPESKKNIVLIMGGADKGLDMINLINEIPRYVKNILLLDGSGTDRIKDKLPSYTMYRILSDAIASALKFAKDGDIVLFSPAFASFGMFKNEYDRGEQFVEIVRNL